MIPIPFSKNYFDNLEKRNGNKNGYEPCAICGKGIKIGKTTYRVHVWDGTKLITEMELKSKTQDEIAASYMNTFPVGNDCKRRHPEIQSYLFKVKD